MSARYSYTLWDRDRGGKLVLRHVPFRLVRETPRSARARRLRVCSDALAGLIWLAIVVLVAINSLGCASADGATIPPAGTSPGAQPDLLAYAPTEEALADTERALKRLREATGLDLRIDPDGIPIAMRDRAQGLTECGLTTIRFYPRRLVDVGIQIRRDAWGCWTDRSRTIEHELIHALRAERSVTTEAQRNDHTASGVFQARGGPGYESRLDAASLNKICEAQECAWFEEEVGEPW